MKEHVQSSRENMLNTDRARARETAETYITKPRANTFLELGADMKLLKRDQNPKLRLTALCAMPSVTQRDEKKLLVVASSLVLLFPWFCLDHTPQLCTC